MSVYLCVFISMKKFLYGVKTHAFIPMVLFLWLKLLKWGFCLVLMRAYLFLWCFFIVKNYQNGFFI